MRKLFWLALCLASLALGQAQAWAQTGTLLSRIGPERRLALLIGNAAYQNPEDVLENSVNDVRLMSTVLRASGFEVMTVENATRRQMHEAVSVFGAQLKQNKGVGLFFYAGHGMQVKGVNYLIPIDAQTSRESSATFDSLNVDNLMEVMAEANTTTNIIILDACRNNPYARASGRPSTGGGAGLAQMSAPAGSYVVYSAGVGQTASDGTGGNGLFTQHFSHAVEVGQGRKIQEVMMQVRTSVRRDSEGKQIPWETSALETDFYFYPPQGLQGTNLATTPTLPPIRIAPPESARPVQSQIPTQISLPEKLAAPVVADLAPAPTSQPVSLVAIEKTPATVLAAITVPSQISQPDSPPELVAAPLLAIAAPSLPSSPATPSANPSPSIVALVQPAEQAILPSPLATMAVTASSTEPRPWRFNVQSASGDSTLAVTKVNEQDGWIRWSDDSETHTDGRVRAWRMGSMLIRGAGEDGMWRLPLKVGDLPRITAELVYPDKKSAPARLFVTVASLGGDQLQLNIRADAITDVLQYSAVFKPNEPMPASYQVEIKNRLNGAVSVKISAQRSPN
jgi:Caspase domain